MEEVIIYTTHTATPFFAIALAGRALKLFLVSVVSREMDLITCKPSVPLKHSPQRQLGSYGAVQRITHIEVHDGHSH